MIRTLQALLLILMGSSTTMAAELTDVWTSTESAGARAVLIQHGDKLSLDLHQEVSIDGITHYHAPALGMIGLDMSGNPVFAGRLADGVTAVSVEPRGVDTIIVEIDAVPMVRHFVFVRASAGLVDIGGEWLGGYSQMGLPCPSFSGSTRVLEGNWSIHYLDEDDESRVSLRFSSGRQVCQFNGQQTSSGVLSRIAGNYTCSNGPKGTFSIPDLQKSGIALGGVMEVATQTCGLLRLRFGGFKRSS